MAQDFSTNLPSNSQDESLPPYEEYELEVDETRPSLPIILISAACGIAGGVVGLYVTRIWLGWEVQPSVFVAVLGLSFGLGHSGAGLSVLHRLASSYR